MKVLGYRLVAAPETPGLAVAVDKPLRRGNRQTTSDARRALRLLLDEFGPRGELSKAEPEILAKELFLPGLAESELPRVRTALRRVYKFKNRTFIQGRNGTLVVRSPHAFLQHDLISILGRGGVKNLRLRARNVLEFSLSGPQSLEEVTRNIDACMN